MRNVDRPLSLKQRTMRKTHNPIVLIGSVYFPQRKGYVYMAISVYLLFVFLSFMPLRGDKI